MPRRKTNEEFTQGIYEQVGDEYTFLEPYVNNRTKLKVRHNTCGYTYFVSPSNFLSRKSHCPYCAPNALKPQGTFVKQIQQKYGDRYTVLGKYTGNHYPVKVRCNVCGHVWSPKPTNLLAGRACPVCGNKRTYRKLTKSNEQFIADVAAQVGNEYTFLDPYVNKRTKIRVRHNKCDTIYTVAPENFLKGRRCPYCSVHIYWQNILYTEGTGWLSKNSNSRDRNHGDK